MGNTKKILLVEDNKINQDMLSRRLLRRGYEVVIANNGAEGCSLALSQQPDLILMDMSLPEIDGWEATRRLKADKQTSSIPIIALTAHAMVGDLEKAMAAGCDDYDTKPVDLPKLLQKMEALLAKCQTVEPAKIEQQVTSMIKNRQNVSAEVASPEIATSKTLLIVDDNEINRDMLSRRLKRAGYKVLLAVSGEEAIKIVRQQALDLVLLDIMMPGLSGLDTLKELREIYSQAQLPVLMATAKDESKDIVQAFELGANDYITKPIDFPVALARIQSHLNTLQAARRESIVEESSTQKQTEKLPANLVESPKALNLDVEKQQSILFVPQEETKLLRRLPKAIKLLYAPIDNGLWKTGSLVKLSAQRAEIYSNKKIQFSLQSEIKIRLWNQNYRKIAGDISATFLGISEEDHDSFVIQFNSPSPVIETILNQYCLVEEKEVLVE